MEIQEEEKILLKENERLRDEIRKLAITSEAVLSCSNTSCISDSFTEGNQTSTLNSDTSNENNPIKSDPPKKSLIHCIIDHPSRLRTQEASSIIKNETKVCVNDKSRRMIGEIALQLDRRILQHVFAPRKRLYGFTVRNIREKIEECSTDAEGKLYDQSREGLLSRHESLMTFLFCSAGYHEAYHATFSELLVNTFGVLRQKSKTTQQYEDLKCLVNDSLKESYARETMILLDSLAALAKLDAKPLFI